MRFARLPSIPRAVAWSDDGDRLLVGCNDGRIRVFDPDSMDVMSDQQGLPRRIHELLLDARANRLLLAGESGCRAGPSPFAEPK
jgi:WD40 repeat protein